MPRVVQIMLFRYLLIVHGTYWVSICPKNLWYKYGIIHRPLGICHARCVIFDCLTLHRHRLCCCALILLRRRDTNAGRVCVAVRAEVEHVQAVPRRQVPHRQAVPLPQVQGHWPGESSCCAVSGIETRNALNMRGYVHVL